MAGFRSSSFSIAAAKSQASEFAQRIAAISHQSMGAMGFTHEHILHHYTRRLWVWRRDFGSETFWGEKIGQAYAKALKLDPKHTGALEYQGVLFIKLNQIDKAKANLALIKSICGNTTCESYVDLAKAIG